MNDFVKVHVKGYTRKDGTYVKEHETTMSKQEYVDKVYKQLNSATWNNQPKQHNKPNNQPKQHNNPKTWEPKQAGVLFPIKPPPPPEGFHPRTDEKGRKVPIYHLHHASDPATWFLAHHEATVVPDGPLPPKLNGVAFAPWQAPTTPDGWNHTEGLNPFVEEPPFEPGKLEPASGVVIEESDGRVWVVCPTNQHAGYKATYPKGHTETGLSLQATALKEAFEESGLQCEITGFLGDFPGGLTLTRYYRARRIGGTPAAMGWETQAVKLVPRDELAGVVNASRDRLIAEAIQ